jgi:GNAT superfamily N-acetyltransferase
MEIRDAVPEDAPAASEVIRRSISELCHTDRLNDPVIFGRWLESGTILAVGSVTDGGEITLNYASSDARFCAVSRALLAALETRAQERRNQRCTLLNTETAHRFYRSAGYADDGPPQGKFGPAASYPMSKQLTRPPGQ